MASKMNDSPRYQGIPIATMDTNNNGNLPVFVRKYGVEGITPHLHRHQAMQINYIMSGRAVHIINNASFEVVKGDIFVIPPYIPHKLSFLPESEVQILELEFETDFVWGNSIGIENMETFFDFAYIEPFLVSEGEVRPRVNISGSQQMVMEKILNDIYEEYVQEQKGYLLAIKADVLKLLVLLGRYFQLNAESSGNNAIFDRHRDAIMQALAYVDTNYTEDIRIEDVIRVAMMSRSYFCYLFKNITGKTLVEYLNDLRINRATELLKNSDEMIMQVCFDSGFNNISHFNRVFKSNMGISPRQYRAANSRHGK